MISPASSGNSPGGSTSLRDAIVAALEPPRHGPASWIDRLPEDAREEVIALKRDWRAGAVPASARSLARTIVAHFTAAGLPVCKLDGVRAWLAD